MKRQSPLLRPATIDGEDVQLPHGMRVRDRHVADKTIFGCYARGGKLEALGRALLSATTISSAARSAGVDRKLAKKFYLILMAQRQRAGLGMIRCLCGRPLTHRGLCEPRKAERARTRYSIEVEECRRQTRKLQRQAVFSLRDDDTVTITEASAIGGYSWNHIHYLMRNGKIRNAGAPGRPRIRRSEVPTKPSAHFLPSDEVGHATGEFDRECRCRPHVRPSHEMIFVHHNNFAA